MSKSSFWHTTCSALVAGSEPDWAEVYDYRQPLLLFLQARYSWLPEGDREDLAQEILLEIKEKLFTRYKSEKGKFRAYLSGVVRNKVLSRWKRNKRHVPLEAIAEPVGMTEEEGIAVDVVADILGALRRWHDRYGGGFPQDLTRIYVMAGRLVRGETYKEISKREGISTHAVKRILSGARREIMADLLKSTLPLRPEQKQGLDWDMLAERARDSLADPRTRHQELEKVAHQPVRQALELWLETYERALRNLPGGDTLAGEELKKGLRVIFGEE